MANTTWNPADLSNVTLSGGNLIETPTAQGGVRSVDSHATGKYYFECTFAAAGNQAGCGVANGVATLSGAIITGLSVALCNNAGSIAVNGIGQTGVGAFVANGVCCIAVDVGASLIWFRNGAAGNWNGSSTANPATGVGGYSVSGLNGGATPLFAYAGGTGSGASVITANFGGSAFAGVAPSGFTAGWPTAVPPNYVDFSGNIGLPAFYGKALYGQKLYSRGGAFAPAIAGDISLVGQQYFVGNLAPVVTFAGKVGFDFQFAGNLAPQITFNANLTETYRLIGAIVPQVSFAADLTVVISLQEALYGRMDPVVTFACSGMISGPLWPESVPCPPPMWTPVAPCDEVVWAPAEQCNG